MTDDPRIGTLKKGRTTVLVGIRVQHRPEVEPVDLPHSLQGMRTLAFQCKWHPSGRMQETPWALPVLSKYGQKYSPIIFTI